MKAKLIEAIQKERNLFDARHQDTSDHDVALNYLKHGVLPSMGVDQYELLDAVINDFETICSDYGIKQENKENEIELKSCPFCGGKAEYEKGHEHSYIGGYDTTIYLKCLGCSVKLSDWFGQSGKDIRTEEQAKNNLFTEWNTRTQSEN